MRILMLCTKFSLVTDDGWLTNELAAALQASGHHVQVVLVAWSGEPKDASVATTTADGINVLLVPPRSLRGFGTFVHKATKWVASPYFARREIEAEIGKQSFDLLLCFSPA